MNLRWLSACVLSLFLARSDAWAQTQAADKAAAEALFDRGLALMREGNFAEGCARLEQSQAIEHGIGTMLYLAECYERLGRTASAWATFREASSQAAAAGQVERADAGRKRADKLERSLSMLTVEVPPGSIVDGLEISRNGTPIPRGVWGIPIPVDPGPQHIDARAPAHAPWQAVVQVGDNAARERVSLPRLSPSLVGSSPDDGAPASTASTAEGSRARSSTPGTTHDAEQVGSTQRLFGAIVGATGLATLALGGGFGIRAIRKNNDAKDQCPANRCTVQGKQLTDEANDAARISNGTFIAGGVLLAAGVVLFLTAPKPSKLSMQPALSPHYAGLDVGGVF